MQSTLLGTTMQEINGLGKPSEGEHQVAGDFVFFTRLSMKLSGDNLSLEESMKWTA